MIRIGHRLEAAAGIIRNDWYRPARYCNFCSCEDCRTGTRWLEHAPTTDGRWICDVCFSYDQCTTGPNRADHPCDDILCEHRPRLSGPWVR